jgi:hypothetical protein
MVIPKAPARTDDAIRPAIEALGCVAEYRASLAHQLRESADRIIDGKGVLPLEHASSMRPTAA